MGSRAVWLWVFIGCLTATGVLGIVALLMPQAPYTQEAIVTAMLLGSFALTSLGASAAAGKRGNVVLARGALMAIGLSLIGWLTLIWLESVSLIDDNAESIAKSSGTLTAVGLAGLHAALIRLASLRRARFRWIQLGSIATASVAAILFSLAIWGVIGDMDDWLGRILGSLLICASVGTLVVPILARIESLAFVASGDSSLAQSTPVELSCPRCGSQQRIPANRAAACQSCGLKLRIEMEEPRCACGYLLFGLTDRVCPECGADLPIEDVWVGVEGRAQSSPSTAEGSKTRGESGIPSLGDGDAAS